MNAVILITGWLSIVSCSLFLLANVEYIDESGSYHFLMGAVLFAMVTVVLGNRLESIVLKKSVLLLIVFLTYFFLKLILDIEDFEVIKGYTIGTSGGVFFALLLGLLASLIISDLHLRMSKNYHLQNLGIMLLLGYFVLTLFLGWRILQGHYVHVRSDLFLLAKQSGNYQRPGNFLFILFMILSSLLVIVTALLNRSSGWKKRIILTVNIGIYILNAILFMLISQLLGSNSGFATVAGFLLITLVYLYAIRPFGSREWWDLRYGVSNLLFGRIGRRVRASMVVVLVLAFAGLFAALQYLKIDVSRFRIMGFKSGSISSFDTRSEIFRNNFIEHLAYNPFFGNAQVEVLTTGVGTYVHSLLSIITHLGFFGFFLFLLFLRQIYLEIIQIKPGQRSLYNDRSFGFYRLLAMGSILVFALISAFYTWMPLWFAIGFYGLSLWQPSLFRTRL